MLLVTALALYVLAPSLAEVFSAWDELADLNPIWFVIMCSAEVASFISFWALFRLALRTDGWFAVSASHLASNAFSRIVPGGAAAGGALQYQMLTSIGEPAPKVATALTGASLLVTAMLFTLPLLALPAILFGAPVPNSLLTTALLGGLVFLAMFAVALVLITHDRLLVWVGNGLERARYRLRHRERGPATPTLGQRLLQDRIDLSRIIGRHWRAALGFAIGKWGLDFLALLSAVVATGATEVDPVLVLLAYVAAAVLAMIPITPGGLGFVEAGLTATLAVAGVGAANAVLATLAYRLVNYWVPLPAGLTAWVWFRRRYATEIASQRAG